MDELNDEEKQELTLKLANSRKLKALMEHPGWTDVIKPRMAGLRAALINGMLAERMDLNGFLLAQQTVNAIDHLIGGLNEAVVQEGKNAAERLQAEREDRIE